MTNTQTLPMDWSTGDGTPEEPRQLYQGPDGLLYTMDTDQPVVCSWFAMCEGHAADVRPHPGGGGVPTCQKHIDWLESERHTLP